MAYKYTTQDERFGPKEELTIKEIMIRYRTLGYDIKGDGTRMAINEMLEDIFEHGVKCIEKPDFL